MCACVCVLDELRLTLFYFHVELSALTHTEDTHTRAHTH